MSTAPHIVHDDNDWPKVAAIPIAGMSHICSLAGASGTSTANFGGQRVAFLSMSMNATARGLYQPIANRAIGEALIAGIRAAMDEAGL